MGEYRPLSDRQWEQIGPSIPTWRQVGRGRPRTDSRVVLDAILYVLQTGRYWTSLPKHFGCSGSTARRTYIRWVDDGDWAHIWSAYVTSLFGEEDQVFWETVQTWFSTMSGSTLIVVRVGTGVIVPTIESRWW